MYDRTLEVLTEAYAKIRNHWVAGKRSDGFGNYCALGAIDAVTGYDNSREGALEALKKGIEQTWLPSDPYNCEEPRPTETVFAQQAIAAVSNSGPDAANRMFERAIEIRKAELKALEPPKTILRHGEFVVDEQVEEMVSA